MQEHGLKISELVTLFNLEVLNRGSDYDTALLTITDVNRPGLQFHSFYDYFDPRRLQVLGKAEITYLKGLTTEQRRKCFDDLFLYDIPALVISRGLDCFPECLESARVHERTLLRTEETTVEFTSHTIEYLNRVLAPCVTRHGVLLDISGEGVMITGDSGIGKSESAIELIMRGHRLVLVFFGFVPVGCTYYVMAHDWNMSVTMASLACGLIIDTLLMINNFRDREQDAVSGKKTIVVRLGAKAGLILYFLLGVAACWCCFYFLKIGKIYAVLLPQLYLIPHILTTQHMARIYRGKALNGILGETSRNMLIFGLLLTLGLIL